MTIYTLHVFHSQIGTSPLSHIQFLTYIQVSQEAGKVGWYSYLFKNFPFVVIHIVKDFSVVNETDVNDFFFIILLFLWANGCWQFDLWFLCLSYNQLEHLEVLSSHTVEAFLGEL